MHFITKFTDYSNNTRKLDEHGALATPPHAASITCYRPNTNQFRCRSHDVSNTRFSRVFVSPFTSTCTALVYLVLSFSSADTVCLPASHGTQDTLALFLR